MAATLLCRVSFLLLRFVVCRFYWCFIRSVLAINTTDIYWSLMCKENEKYDGFVLFSGGLDSILAAKVLEAQNLRIKCLHFLSPFFGDARSVKKWRKKYTLDIDAIDISQEYIELFKTKPQNGIGSVLNPCIDCKIIMMRKAASLMEQYGVSFIASGEVLGQRPMSQRRDTLNIISRDSGVKPVLLRPLCAKLMDPTSVELSGLVNRERLLGFNGRGRKEQLALAAEFGITDIPTPGGGCLLTERENARSYWPVMRYSSTLQPADFTLSNIGRQLWGFDAEKQAHWLCIGRDRNDNTVIQELASENDICFKVKDFPGPLAIARQFKPWSKEAIKDAAAVVASFSGKAVGAAADGKEVVVRVHYGEKGLDGPGEVVYVQPDRAGQMHWAGYNWEQAKEEIKEYFRR